LYYDTKFESITKTAIISYTVLGTGLLLILKLQLYRNPIISFQLKRTFIKWRWPKPTVWIVREAIWFTRHAKKAIPV